MGCFLSCCFDVGVNPADPSVSAYALTNRYTSKGDAGYTDLFSTTSTAVYVRGGMLYLDSADCCLGGTRGYPISNISSVEVVGGESAVVGGNVVVCEPKVKITGANNTSIVFSTPNAEHFARALEVARHSTTVVN